ncbi:hypothetical protein [Neobacillus sp.]|uniref:YqaI family protein n=1 Tax=Neobacillus sp. TaxID=2675273 RepID=UPI0035B52971
MRDVEHPVITKINRTGYINMTQQPEHIGIDYFGNEILAGDSIVIDHRNGEIILEDNLEDYLIEVLDLQFTTAK